MQQELQRLKEGWMKAARMASDALKEKDKDLEKLRREWLNEGWKKGARVASQALKEKDKDLETLKREASHALKEKDKKLEKLKRESKAECDEKNSLQKELYLLKERCAERRFVSDDSDNMRKLAEMEVQLPPRIVDEDLRTIRVMMFGRSVVKVACVPLPRSGGVGSSV
eukprot:gene30761-35800_t